MAFLNESGLTRYDGKLKGLIAGAYSASATYDVGDYCIHGGSLYKCTTAIAAAEAWTSDHWTKINLADEIDAAKEDLEKLKLDVADAYSASDAHAVGDYVVRNSVLYRCTTAIGSGGEMWNAAHWTTVNIGDELVAIKAGIDLLEEDLADEYSSSSTYAVGDYCMKDGVLYRCTTAISTAEAWTSGHWTAAQVGDELCDLKGSLTSIQGQITANVETSTTASKAYSAGEYLVLNGTLYRVALDIQNGSTITIGTNVISCNMGTELTALTKEISDNIEKSGAVTTGTIDSAICFKKGNVVFASGRIYGMTNQVATGNFFVLPNGFAPKQVIYGNAYIAANGSLIPTFCIIRPSGNVALSHSSTLQIDQVYFSCSFPI